MHWKDLQNYFPTPPPVFLQDLFRLADYPWSPLKGLQKKIIAYFDDLNDQGGLPAKRKILFNKEGSLREGSYFIEESKILTENFIDQELKIFIGAGTLLEAGATIKDHSIIECDCEIRQGAYIRGNVYIGEHSVVGHTTEIKGSIFTQHVEAGHFAYIGDSIIGSYVNLGAGTKISNLQFRSLEDKKNENFPEIPFLVSGEPVNTGLSKFGAIIGDGSETGCNSVLSPFALLAAETWVVPNLCVLKGVYPKGSILKSIDDCKRKQL